MYHPYFRGKQYELVCIRESALLLRQSDFVPVIEPVKESFTGLRRALEQVEKAHGQVVVIANPAHGDMAGRGDDVAKQLTEALSGLTCVSYALALRQEHTVNDIVAFCRAATTPISLVHCGFGNGKELAKALEEIEIARHIFNEPDCGKLYRKHFDRAHRVLLRDGFKKRPNKEYPPVEPFSDLHATFKDEGMNGFGDYLVVGDDYSESGGPAYAIAIHLTFVDPERDEAMFVFHFKSDRTDTPADPAGKFAEALDKLVDEVQRSGTHVLRTKAVNEFIDLQRQGHFPGLGHVKKLSMSHHMETLADYLGRQRR